MNTNQWSQVYTLSPLINWYVLPTYVSFPCAVFNPMENFMTVDFQEINHTGTTTG